MTWFVNVGVEELKCTARNSDLKWHLGIKGSMNGTLSKYIRQWRILLYLNLFHSENRSNALNTMYISYCARHDNGLLRVRYSLCKLFVHDLWLAHINMCWVKCKTMSGLFLFLQVKYAAPKDTVVMFMFYQPIRYQWRETDFFPCSVKCGGGKKKKSNYLSYVTWLSVFYAHLLSI